MLRFLRTLRNLRPSQILWRFLYRLERSFPANPRRYSYPDDRIPSLRADFPAIPPIHTIEPDEVTVQEISRGVFRHINRSYTVGRDQPDWRLGPCSTDRLWTVTLHYHEWAYRLAQAAGGTGAHGPEAGGLFRHYVDDWIETCRMETPGACELAWNAYAIATRIGWWVRSRQLINDPDVIAGPGFRDRFLRSLWQQTSYLHKHLEYDLRANHLLRDAVGLVWAGRFFDEPEAREWSRTAARIALEQAAEQVLPDGGHFERSPMYHIHVMEDFLLLALLLEEPDDRKMLQEVWRRMADYLTWCRHPDGEIPLLNDAALNSACSPQEMLSAPLHKYGAVFLSTHGSVPASLPGAPGEETGTEAGATRSEMAYVNVSPYLRQRALRQRKWIGLDVSTAPKHGGRLFPDFGLFAWHGDPWTIFFDVGQIGVTYQLGHAHADTLAIEASFRGERFLVDPGTWAYDLDARREYDRSTAAHNTVCVDGLNSSEVWHIFRCGRAAHPCNVQVQMDSSGFKAGAAHTGYAHLPGRPVLTREVILHDNGRLEIIDRCAGKGVHNLTGGWLLDPRWTAENAGSAWRVSTPACGAVRVQIEGPRSLELSECSRWYHPEFGTESTTTRLQWAYEGPLQVEVTTIFAPG